MDLLGDLLQQGWLLVQEASGALEAPIEPLITGTK